MKDFTKLLQYRVEDWGRRSGESGARVGVALFCFRTGRRWEMDGDKGFAPASNNKLWTTLAALDELGPQHRWRTRFAVDEGCLSIRGGGDPSFDEAAALRVARELKAKGLTHLVGPVVVDDAFSGDHPWGKGWMWDDLAQGYGAPVHALIMEGNRVTFHFDPATDPPKVVRVSPRFCRASAVSVLTWTDRSDPEVEIFRTGIHEYKIRGALSRREPELEAAVASGPEFFAEVMVGALRESGVSVSEGIPVVRGPFSQGAAIRVDRISPTLAEVLHRVNKDSDNLTAEILLRSMGMGKMGFLSEEGGLLRVMDWFRKRGLPPPDIYADGSGLSGYNRSTPAALLNTLIWALRNHPAFPVWLKSLPRYGVDGTLEDRSGTLPAGIEVAAKTGSLAGVQNLSGYILNTEGAPVLAFSLLTNGLLEEEKGKELQDEFLQLVTEVL